MPEGVAGLSGPRLWFTILGPVRAWRDGVELELGARQQRTVLALLLVSAGRPISIAEMVDAMWGQQPPATAVNSVQRNIGTLRRLFEPNLRLRETGRWLVRVGTGYRMTVDAESLDLLRFQRLMASARKDSDPADAYVEALGLWLAPGDSGIDPDVRGHRLFSALDRQYAAAAREAADAAIATGEPERLLAAVQRAAEWDPFDEALAARLMLMLAATGRQAEALSVFQQMSGRLAEALGIDASAELTAARDRVLRQQAAPARVDVVQVNAVVGPPSLPSFMGRRSA